MRPAVDRQSRSFLGAVVPHLVDYRLTGGSGSGDWYECSDATPHLGRPTGGDRAMIIGWAYFMAGVMTVDALLLGLLLFNVKWPKHWKRNG